VPKHVEQGATAGGDLAGSTYPNPVVASLQGVVISGTPSSAQVLTATSPTAAHWAAPTGGGAVTSLTTTGSGAATLSSGVLNVPTPPTATFNSLTTTGTSGAATLASGVLNIPNYATGGVSLSAANTWTGTQTFNLETENKGGVRILSDGSVGITLDGSGLGENIWAIKQGSDGTFLFDQSGGMNGRFKLGNATSAFYDFTPDYSVSVFKVTGAGVVTTKNNTLDDSSGNATIAGLAGTGSRMVVASSAGLLSTQALPSASFITSITTTGTSGAATVASGVLNIPQYSGGSGGSGITRSIASVSTATTAGATAATDYVYLVSGITTLTLPTAVSNLNKYTVKNTGSNAVTVATTSSQQIDGTTTITLNPLDSVDLISNGTNWYII
jgi:hypothetical protein